MTAFPFFVSMKKRADMKVVGKTPPIKVMPTVMSTKILCNIAMSCSITVTLVLMRQPPAWPDF